MSKIEIRDLTDMPETPIQDLTQPTNTTVTPADDDDFDFEILDIDSEDFINNEEPESKQRKRRHKDKKKHSKTPLVLSIVIIVLLAIIAGLVAYFFFTPKPEPISQAPESTSSNVLVDATAIDASRETVAKEAEETPMFTATGFYDMTLKSGDKVNLTNSQKNHTPDYDVYMQYIIYEIKNDGQQVEIYETGIILPGMMVEWEATNFLPEGDHKIRILEQPYLLNEITGEYDPKFSADQYITVTIQ